jgi:hypothetical protein
LDDRAAIPSRISTYLLAGLPVITDRRPGYFRYEELSRLGVNIDLVDGDYAGLRDRLTAEAGTRERAARAVAGREAYSFDAAIDPLLDALTRARADYFERSPADRTRFVEGGRPRVTYLKHRHYRRSAPGSLAAGLSPRTAPAGQTVAMVERGVASLSLHTLTRWKVRRIRRALSGADPQR